MLKLSSHEVQEDAVIYFEITAEAQRTDWSILGTPFSIPIWNSSLGTLPLVPLDPALLKQIESNEADKLSMKSFALVFPDFSAAKKFRTDFMVLHQTWLEEQKVLDHSEDSTYPSAQNHSRTSPSPPPSLAPYEAMTFSSALSRWRTGL